MSDLRDYIDCPTCGGSGEVSWNHTRDPQLERSGRCVTCHGEGVIPRERADRVPDSVTPLTPGQRALIDRLFADATAEAPEMPSRDRVGQTQRRDAPHERSTT